MDNIGIDYTGMRNVTREGSPCRTWSSHVGVYIETNITLADPIIDENFPEGDVGLARNYCRNPDNDSRGLWCFTGDRDPLAYQFCDIPLCGSEITKGNDQ